MISILGYSLCNFVAGFSPTFWFLFLFRALLGFFMGAEWPAGAAFAMEQWPQGSRGLMSGVDRLRQRRRIPGKHVLGLGRRPYCAALGDDYPRPVRGAADRGITGSRERPRS